jgi:hypothetical protein
MKILIFFFSLLLIVPQQTDTYYIIKVSGNITNSVTGQILSQGDEILATDQIQFSDKNDYALIVSDNNARFKMKYPKVAGNIEGPYTEIVKNTLNSSGKTRIKTRGIITNADIKDLKEFLGDDEFTVIGNSLNVQLSKQTFEDKTVVAKYDKNGEIIDKPIINEDYKLDLSRKTLGVKSSGEVKLYHVDFYQQDDSEGYQKITRLDVNFVDEPVLKDELATIIGVYKKKDYDKNKMKSFLMEYFLDFYGNTHMFTLSEFVDKIIEDKMN